MASTTSGGEEKVTSVMKSMTGLGELASSCKQISNCHYKVAFIAQTMHINPNNYNFATIYAKQQDIGLG